MSSKVLRYMNNTINQEKLYDSIYEDIEGIFEPYNFKKVFFVKTGIPGEIRIEIQENTIPFKLITELNNYFELECTLKRQTHCIELIYKIEKGR